jgi:hypothetical protein
MEVKFEKLPIFQFHFYDILEKPKKNVNISTCHGWGGLTQRAQGTFWDEANFSYHDVVMIT